MSASANMRELLRDAESRVERLMQTSATLTLTNLQGTKQQIAATVGLLLELHRAAIARIEALENNNNKEGDHGDTHRESELPALR